MGPSNGFLLIVEYQQTSFQPWQQYPPIGGSGSCILGLIHFWPPKVLAPSASKEVPLLALLISPIDIGSWISRRLQMQGGNVKYGLWPAYEGTT